jgi:hypothetical protein|tara:strand:- start:88 stop:687 length:600 start_codon:yes stop_codon:yes gene_type:complete
MINCDIEEYIPIPTSSKSYSSVRAKAEAACNAATLLEQEGYKGPQATPEKAREGAANILNALAKGQEPPYAMQEAAFDTPRGAIMVRNILSEYDVEVVREAKQLRHYVTNRLVIESDNMDARIRMKALELLGKISDVGLFSERTEVTINTKSTIELEDTLKAKLRKLKGITEAVDATIISGPILDSRVIDVREALRSVQ